MRTYIVKRIILFVPTLLIVTVIVFTLLRIIPGDPAILILGGEGDDTFTQAQLDKLRAELGTDKPIYVQYVLWIGNMLKLDFGTSYFYEGDPVIEDLLRRIPITLELAILSLLVASMFAVPRNVAASTFCRVKLANMWEKRARCAVELSTTSIKPARAAGPPYSSMIKAPLSREDHQFRIKSFRTPSK